MEEEMGKRLQIKSQDELIGEEGLSDPISTIPRTQEEHEELDKLNEYFSERL
ncbi:hypothetical protein RhiirC2_771523 [Rhizophagus irregularis]|uniref:Uncharacterized protein n=1 Tax=Rhizophagus irregularis TaxID=588596 RepID=A0A2N1NTS9_9GLOM|nr:hypothetical protein RhiirC2_771523 [Rhizophagus irregularis]